MALLPRDDRHQLVNWLTDEVCRRRAWPKDPSCGELTWKRQGTTTVHDGDLWLPGRMPQTGPCTGRGAVLRLNGRR